MELVMQQITYNEIMGVLAGLIMLIAADAFRLFRVNGSGSGSPAVDGEVVAPADGVAPVDLRSRLRSHALALGLLGPVLALLGLLMSTNWPLIHNTPTNIVFGQPSLFLGVLAVGGAVGIARGFDMATMDRRPIAWMIAAVGAILIVIATAIWDYEFMGSPPPTEPITGQLGFWADGGGVVIWGIVFAVAGIGCIATLAWAYRPNWRIPFHIIRWSWVAAGLFFLLFALLNFRTHIGQIVNIQQDAGIRW
jgi:uncharacterized membrane protein